MSLQNQHALVTGAGRGIGAAIAAALTRSGARVTALGRTESHLQALVARGDAAGYATADVTNEASLSEAIAAAVAERGPIDLLIADVYHHAAGAVAAGPALAEFLGREGAVGLGIVPSEEEALLHETPDTLARRIEGLLASLQPHGIAPERLLRQAAIAPNDMLGRLSPEVAERALQLLADTSRLLRERYSLE